MAASYLPEIKYGRAEGVLVHGWRSLLLDSLLAQT